MVLVLYGTSEIGAHACGEIRSDFFCIENVFYRQQIQFDLKETVFLHTCATCFDLPSHINTMIVTDIYESFTSVA